MKIIDLIENNPNYLIYTHKNLGLGKSSRNLKNKINKFNTAEHDDHKLYGMYINQYGYKAMPSKRKEVEDEKLIFDNIFFDFDDEDDADKAIADAQKFCKELKEAGLKPLMCFSGTKGAHVHLFFEEVPLKYGIDNFLNNLYELLSPRYNTLDKKVFSAKRIKRLPFSRRNNGNYCIPVDYNLSLEKLLEYIDENYNINPFSNPNTFNPSISIEDNTENISVFTNACDVKPVEKATNNKGKTVATNNNNDEKIISLIDSILPKTKGRHNDLVLGLAGGLEYAGYDSAILKKVPHIQEEHMKEVNHEYNGNKIGFKTLFKDYPEIKEELQELYNLVNKGNEHTFLLKEFNPFKKQYLKIDYDEYEISTYTWEQTKDNKGNIYTNYTNIYPILNLAPLDIYELYNILDINSSPDICFTYYRKGMPYKQTIKGSDIESVERQLKKRPGIVLKPREYNGLLNELVKEYIKLDKMHTVAEIPIQGIFINPLTAELARAGRNGKLRITKPPVEQIKNGLSVWKKLKNIYKGDLTKLSHILRYGIRMPFSYIFKTEYEWIPMLFLYGASQTAKTTLASISLAPYATVDDEISIGGSSADTEYRMGNVLSRQGIGCIINEPSNVIENKSSMLDLLKRATEDKYCREKMEDGVHVKVPAYSNIIFTSNTFMPTQDAFVRRTEFIEFTKADRMSPEDKEKFKETFHHVNWRNTDFNLLRPVGDFFVWYVSTNMDVLKYNPSSFVDTLLDNLFEYIGEDKNEWEWIYQDTQLMEIKDSDNMVLDDLRNMIWQDYRKLINTNNLPDIDDEEPEFDFLINEDSAADYFKDNFLRLAQHGMFDYIFINASGEVCIRASVGKALKKFCGTQVTGTSLASLLDKKVESNWCGNQEKTIKSFSMSFDEFWMLIL